MRTSAAALPATIATALLMASALFSPVSADADEQAKACTEKVSTVRTWFRGTVPPIPMEDRLKLEDGIKGAVETCEAALAANPDDPRLALTLAYASISAEDHARAVELMRQAAEAEHPPAMLAYARLLGRGQYVDRDAEGAWEMLLGALKSGDEAVQIEAALEFLPGGAGPESPKRVRKTFETLIADGSPEAMITYAMRVLKIAKDGTPDKTVQEGLDLLRRAADEQGSSNAMVTLGLIHLQGQLVAADRALARSYIERAAEAGDPRAFTAMAQIHQSDQNFEEALVWFRKGAEKGDAFAQFMIGFIHMSGVGVPQDMEAAVDWWETARWNGSRQAGSYLKVHRERNQ